MTMYGTLVERLTSAPRSNRNFTAAVCLYLQATKSGDCPIYDIIWYIVELQLLKDPIMTGYIDFTEFGRLTTAP